MRPLNLLKEYNNLFIKNELRCYNILISKNVLKEGNNLRLDNEFKGYNNLISKKCIKKEK